jgi:uncharacterized protein YjdB
LKVLDGNAAALPATTQLAVRGTYALSAGLWYHNTCPSSYLALTWSSSAASLASVASTGGNTAVVTGVAPAGSVSISVSVPGVVRSANFTVVAGPLHHIAITPANPALIVGTTRQLAADLLDQDGFPTTGTPGSVVWSLPTHAPVTISATGLVTAVAVGTVTVTATYTAATPNLTATTVVTITAVPIGSVTVTPPTASVAVGASAVPFTATVRDINGLILPGTGVTWQSLNTGVATVGAVSGTVTGVAAGTATIRAISDGNVSIFGDAQLTVTAPAPSAALIAYAVADQPASASYTADLTAQFNGQGGAITVTRSGTGQYTVTIPGFGGAGGASRIPFVNAVSTTGVVCLAVSWSMIGVTDATVRVDCSTAAGALTDSKFTIFAAGQGALPGRFAFANSGALPAGTTPVTLGAGAAWSSSGLSPTLTRDGSSAAGLFDLGLRLPTGAFVDVAVVQPAGATTARCQVSSWGPSQGIGCFPAGAAGGALADAQFSGMFVYEGRAGKRFGAVHSTSVALSRNSAGGGNSVASLGGGAYRATFGSLGHSAGGRETVLVTAHVGFSFSAFCNPSAWNTVGADLVVDIACFNGAGTPITFADFIVVVIE